MKPRLLMVAMAILMSCQSKSSNTNSKTKLLDYKYFTMRVPKEWKALEAESEDSYVGNIAIDSNTFVNFDLGWYSNQLDEGSEDYSVRHDSLIVKRELPVKVNGKNYTYDYRGKPDSSIIAPLTINRKQWITIDGYKAKLVTPVRTGNGTTGVYIDSLWKAGDSNDRFQINGQNLTLKQQQQLIAAMKTLKFYQHPSK